MVKSKLPNAMLGKIWKLADVDMDGKLDMDEFALVSFSNFDDKDVDIN